MRHIAVSLRISRHPSVNSACQLIISFQTQLLQHLVGLFSIAHVLLVDVLLGWNLFVAAMTSNENLRSSLINSIHNRASYNTTDGVFPLNYATSDGVALSGQAR
jgi:Domain of unknown function (DUF1793)